MDEITGNLGRKNIFLAGMKAYIPKYFTPLLSTHTSSAPCCRVDYVLPLEALDSFGFWDIPFSWLSCWVLLLSLLCWFLLMLEAQVSILGPVSHLHSLGDFIQTYYFKYHQCADNSQNDISSLDLSLEFQTPSNCLLNISTHDARQLKLNMDKTKVLVFPSKSVL